GAVEGGGEALHIAECFVVEGVYDGVIVGEDEAVGFAIAFHAEAAGVGPVYDVAKGFSFEVDGFEEFGGLFASGGADEAVGFAEGEEELRFQVGVVVADGADVSGVVVIVICHEDGLEDPFGGPGGVVEAVFVGAAGHGVFAVDAVVGELIDVGVGFVGD